MTFNLRIGPSTLGPLNEAIKNLEFYAQNKIKACEIAFTYGIYIKEKYNANKIRDAAKKLKIKLSIHAPYYINLNSKEKQKIHMSKKRILDCCEIGHELGVENVVFHAGFYAGMSPEVTYINIKEQIIELQNTIKEKGWKVKLSPEVMGKVNVFGSIDDISNLAKETGCSFCIDFAHILARYNSHKFEEVIKAFPQKDWHCHFSGIEYSPKKGERKHIPTTKEDWENIFNNIKHLDKNITIISESPNPEDDAIQAINLFENTSN